MGRILNHRGMLFAPELAVPGRKPSTPGMLEVDWQNHLLEKVAYLWPVLHPDSAGWVEEVSGARGDMRYHPDADSAAFAVGFDEFSAAPHHRLGLGHKTGNATGSLGGIRNWLGGLVWPSASLGSARIHGATNLTMFVVFQARKDGLHSGSQYESLFLRSNGSSSPLHFSLGINGAAGSRKVRALIGTSGTTGWTGANDKSYTDVTPDQGPEILVATWDGSTLHYYHGRVGTFTSIGTATVTGSMASADAPVAIMGDVFDQNPAASYLGLLPPATFLLGGVTAGFWDAGKVASFYADPFQMLRVKEDTSFFLPVAGGGPTYTQSVAGGITPSGALDFLIRFDAGAAGALTPTGAMTKKIRTSAAGSLASAGATIKKINIGVSGTMSSTGTMLKTIKTTMAGAITPAGEQTIKWMQAVAGTLGLAGAISTILNVGGTASKAFIALFRRRRGSP